MLRLRVLVVHSSSELYGADRSLLDFIEFQADSMDITVAVPTPGTLVRELERVGASVIVGPVCKVAREMLSPFGLLRTLVAVVPSCIFLSSAHRKSKFDVVYSNSIAVLGGAFTARLWGVPHVWHVREILTKFRLVSAVFRFFVDALSTSVICNSHSTREWIAPSAMPAKYRVVWNGVAPKSLSIDRAAQRRRLGVRDGDVLFVLVGRINSWKGQKQLVQAFAQLLREGADNARLVIVGSTVLGQEHYEAELRSLIAELGCGAQVRMLPFQEDTDWIWVAVDIAVVSSTQPEPFGRVAIEAMAFGLPVIAAAHGGLVEIVQDQVTGILYTPRDVRALLQAMRQLTNDPEMRQQMGKAGRTRQQTTFLSRGYAKEVGDILLRTVCPSSGQTG
jgi:glycosyltransferase involved in cell wall biosynthesis